ncbi:MAG: FCD domain-containing protein [Firmicutes bacterium]|nr:FCD domain-containing protein [Bacillota bacterium]
MSYGFQTVGTEKTNCSETIVIQVTELMAAGKLKAGDKLPSERELAGIFNVSRTLARKAIKKLAGLGLAEIKKNHGVFVREVAPEAVNGNVAGALNMGGAETSQLFEIRKVLETQAAAWAAARATGEEIEALAQLVGEAKAKPKLDLALVRDCDERFHDTIVKASHNIALYQMMSGLSVFMHKMRTKTVIIPGRAAQSVEDHQAIARAIGGRNAARASEAMYEHIKSVQDAMEK